MRKPIKPTKPITVEPVLAPVLVEAVPIPPIPDIAPTNILPLVDLPLDKPTITPPCVAKYPALFDEAHPVEPMPTYVKPKMHYFRTGKRHTHNKHGNICHTPVREIIPNAVRPLVMPKHIADVKVKPRINPNNGNIYPRANKFLVSYNLIRIGYSYGANSGYTRENAFMEAARCLRYLLARDIQLLDKAMGVDVELDDLFEFIDMYDDDGNETESTLSHTTSLQRTPYQTTQPIINIINSTVTISNEPSRHVVYDEDDNIEFVFEDPDVPVDYDDMPEINFDEIVEI